MRVVTALSERRPAAQAGTTSAQRPLRVLYAAYRYDPRMIMAGSGIDYQYHQAMLREGLDVQVIGPTIAPIHWLEQTFRNIYTRLSGARYLRFPLSKTWQASAMLNQAERRGRFDLVFATSPAPLVFYRGRTPYIYRLDATTTGSEAYGQRGIGWLALRIARAQERRAFRRSARLITQSQWCKDDLVRNYGIAPEKVEVFPQAAALPAPLLPDSVDIRRDKALEGPLKLLLVGREYERKGVDIALDIVRQLRAAGRPAQLTVCGLEGPEETGVRFAGLFDKGDPPQLEAYMALYRQAHLLLHPARYEPAGIVPGEAAAFSTPTITNATGGLATTVEHGVSGLVLPEHSVPEAYVEAILDLIDDPERYYALCERTRRRYEEELNWEVAGRRLVEIVRDTLVTVGRSSG